MHFLFHTHISALRTIFDFWYSCPSFLQGRVFMTVPTQSDSRQMDDWRFEVEEMTAAGLGGPEEEQPVREEPEPQQQQQQQPPWKEAETNVASRMLVAWKGLLGRSERCTWLHCLLAAQRGLDSNTTGICLSPCQQRNGVDRVVSCADALSLRKSCLPFPLTTQASQVQWG